MDVPSTFESICISHRTTLRHAYNTFLLLNNNTTTNDETTKVYYYVVTSKTWWFDLSRSYSWLHPIAYRCASTR